jgi:hypothetical protein
VGTTVATFKSATQTIDEVVEAVAKHEELSQVRSEMAEVKGNV